MYSASNSFLGGANSARQQQQASPFQQQQQQQQPTGFPQHGLAPQPTGFPGGQQLQPQFTGFPGVPNPTGFQQPYGQPSLQPPQQQQPQLQPQFTGFPGAAPQNQFAPSQPSQTPQQQNAAQQFPSASAAPPTIAVHKTSAQMAQSFIQDSSSSRPTPPPKSGPRMPNMRLSFITAEDQAKFEQLFKAAAGDDVTLDGMCSR